MIDQPRWPREAWAPILAGLAWLGFGASHGLVALLLALIPGALLVGAGTSKLLWPGDLRIPQFGALGGVAGVLLSIPAIFAVGLLPALLLAVLSAASFEPHTEGVPDPHLSLRLSAAVAADEAILATMQLSLPMPSGSEADRIVREIDAAAELFESRGWLEKPAAFHAHPLPLEAPRITRRSVRVRRGRVDFEHLSFESEYEPRPEEPGRDRWLGYFPNRTAHAWVKRHEGGERPWLVCINGYQMGSPRLDFGAFDPHYLHEKLGLDLLIPVLPLHGPRKIGRRSGDGFLSGDVLDTIHAEAQAMWDIGRLLTWVRAQGATRIGVFGLSLGGYTTALLSSLEEGLVCAIPGIPVSDFMRVLWRHGPPFHLHNMSYHGLTPEKTDRVLRVISPLALSPKVPLEGRLLFGGVADRLVPPDQVRDLWQHWEQPRLVWYQGGHLSFPLEREVREAVDDTLRRRLDVPVH
jgi:hypothetical protein